MCCFPSDFRVGNTLKSFGFVIFSKTEKPSAEIVVADKKSSEKIEKEVSTEKATVTGYAVYGGNQKDDLSGENSVEVARKQTEVTENETVKVYEADAEDYAKAAQEEFNSKIKLDDHF